MKNATWGFARAAQMSPRQPRTIRTTGPPERLARGKTGKAGRSGHADARKIATVRKRHRRTAPCGLKTAKICMETYRAVGSGPASILEPGNLRREAIGPRIRGACQQPEMVRKQSENIGFSTAHDHRQAGNWRPEPESNRRARICSPLRNHSAIGPHAKLPHSLTNGPGVGRTALVMGFDRLVKDSPMGLGGVRRDSYARRYGRSRCISIAIQHGLG